MAYGFQSKSDAGKYLITDQTTNLAFVKRCIGFDEETTKQELGDFGPGTIFTYDVTNCFGTPVPFFTCPVVGKLYTVAQVYPTGVNRWAVELATNTKPDDSTNWTIPSVVAVPPTGFSMTLNKFFTDNRFSTPSYPYASGGTIQNVSQVNKGYEPGDAYYTAGHYSRGLSRGSYIMCHDTATYNTSTNVTTQAFAQEYIPSDRRIAFNNICKSGQYLDYKNNGAGRLLNVFQFDGGQTAVSSGGGSSDLIPSSGTPLGGSVHLRLWHRGLLWSEQFEPITLTTNTSQYISSKTRIFLNESDYGRVIVGQYVNYINASTISYVAGTIHIPAHYTVSNVGWKQVVTKNYNSSYGYYIEINGNFPTPDDSDPWYDLRNEPSEKMLPGGDYHPWYYISVRGYPGASTTQSQQYQPSVLTSDYTECNTSFFAMTLDGGVTERSIMHGGTPTTPVPTNWNPANEGDMTLDVASTGRVSPDTNGSTTLRPALGRIPIAEHGGNFTRDKPPRVLAVAYLYANLSNWKHYQKGHTIDRKALRKGQTNIQRIGAGTSGGTSLFFDFGDEDTIGTSLSQVNANRLAIAGTPTDYLEFNQAFSLPRTDNVAIDTQGFITNNKFMVPDTDGTLDEDKYMSMIFQGRYMTCSSGVAAASLPNDSFSFKEKKIYRYSVRSTTGVYTYNPYFLITESTLGCTIPSPTLSGDTKKFRLNFSGISNNQIDFSNSSVVNTDIQVRYTFYVKVANQPLTEIDIVLCIQEPASKLIRIGQNFSLAHRTVTKTYPFTNFIQPTPQFLITGTMLGITGTRTVTLFQLTTYDHRPSSNDLLQPMSTMQTTHASNQYTQLGTVTLTGDSTTYGFYPFIDTFWHDDDVLDSELPFRETVFIVVVEQSGVEVARSFATHIHSETSKVKVGITKIFDTKPWIQPDDESMWLHDGFVETPNTVQTRRRGFVPGVACIQGIVDNIGGWHVQPYYFTSTGDDTDPDSKSWRTMDATWSEVYFDNTYSSSQRHALSYMPPGKMSVSFTPVYSGATQDWSPPYPVYTRTASTSNKWTYSFLDSVALSSINADQVSLDSTARGLLRANYGHLNSSRTIREKLIWRGVTIATSGTIGGISNPITIGSHEYSFNFADTTYTDHYTFVPVSKVGAYVANDFDGFGPATYDDGAIPEIFVFADPGSAPEPHEDEGLIVRSSDGITVFDSRIRPLLITDTTDVSQPSSPVSINCSSLKSDSSKDNFQNHGPVFTPTATSTKSLNYTSSPAFFYNSKTMAEKECSRTSTETKSDLFNFREVEIRHNTKYWAIYKGGIGRHANANTMTSGYVTVAAGAYYQAVESVSYLFGIIDGGTTASKGGISAPFTNVTINNVAQTAISIDTGAYIGTTYTVTASSGGGTIVRLSGEDRNGTFNNVANKELTLFTGDRLKITFHTSNYSIKTAQELSTTFNANSSQTINNNGTIGQIHFVPDIPGTYFYTRTGITNTNSQGRIVVTTG